MMAWHTEGVLGMDGGVKRSGLCIGGAVHLITNLIMISMINVKNCSFRIQPLKKGFWKIIKLVHSL